MVEELKSPKNATALKLKREISLKKMNLVSMWSISGGIWLIGSMYYCKMLNDKIGTVNIPFKDIYLPFIAILVSTLHPTMQWKCVPTAHSSFKWPWLKQPSEELHLQNVFPFPFTQKERWHRKPVIPDLNSHQKTKRRKKNAKKNVRVLPLMPYIPIKMKATRSQSCTSVEVSRNPNLQDLQCGNWVERHMPTNSQQWRRAPKESPLSKLVKSKHF